MEFISDNVTLKSALNAGQMSALEALADAIAADIEKA